TADVEDVKKELEEIAGEVDALAALLLEGFTDDASDAPPIPPIPSADEERQAADSMRIRVVESPDAWTTDAELTFVVENPNNELRDGDKFNWRFGNGAGKPTKKGTYSHTFRRPGTYAVEVDIVRGAGKWRTLSRPVVVRPSETDAVLDEIGRGLKRSEAVLAILAVVLAALSGLTYLYADKPFGTFQDYLLALLWGFGIDSSVRGFAGVFKNFTRQEGK
ncbi:MAG TPA: PKD domain-containing protein, partial [Pyrinomonadaceae bacterium]